MPAALPARSSQRQVRRIRTARARRKAQKAPNDRSHTGISRYPCWIGGPLSASPAANPQLPFSSYGRFGVKRWASAAGHYVWISTMNSSSRRMGQNVGVTWLRALHAAGLLCIVLPPGVIGRGLNRDRATGSCTMPRTTHVATPRPLSRRWRSVLPTRGVGAQALNCCGSAWGTRRRNSRRRKNYAYNSP
jgi:hypothetical protein